jgi:hypothetical protein
MTDHKRESVHRRYAIVSEVDLKETGAKLASLRLKGWVSEPV